LDARSKQELSYYDDDAKFKSGKLPHVFILFVKRLVLPLTPVEVVQEISLKSWTSPM
jgi:hypothetical protein